MEYGRLGSPEPGSLGSSSRSLTPNQTRTPKKSKLKLFLILAAILVLVAAAAASAAVFIRNRDDPRGGAQLHSRRPSQAISRACGRTRYPNLCIDSLLDFPGASEKDLVHISVNVTLRRFGHALYSASEISNLNMDPRVRSAFDDCLELLDDSVDLLSKSLTSVTPGGATAAHDVMTWLSASLTNQETCSEGFDELNGYVKSQMSDHLKDLSELVSNCLAIYSAAAGGGDFSGVPIQNRRRLLSGVKEEHKQFPAWLSRRDRMLMDMPASAITADYIVSKDGNGTSKTIAEAIKKVPDNSTRRYIIYVKAGK
ncbi:putative pectinesterase/pectinesterase inhibitor 34 [Castilleja foliolosa]|uniref:Pectinesterase/pectinesterase inhibitor 34 n=1 Tax=Castilleja foliolosa TaxID=1961234 RepID=A0ABD3EH38_9LAMI